MAGLLYLGAGFGLAMVRLLSRWRGKPAAEAPLKAVDLGWLAIIVLFGGVAGPLLLMLGLVGTPASTAALLLNLEGLATLAIARSEEHTSDPQSLMRISYSVFCLQKQNT